MAKIVTLFRKALTEKYEAEASARVCETKNYIHELAKMNLSKGDVIVPRYFMLPNYKDNEIELKEAIGQASLINTHNEHLYVADLQNWYSDLKDLTPKTWFDISQIPEGQFVLKGETNSKKQQWKKQMFANSKKEAFDVCSILMNDGYVGTQKIYAREYVPLANFGEAVNGMPISEEYRFFFYKDTLLASGFYWSEHAQYVFENNFKPNPKNVPLSLLEKVAQIVSPNISFWVVDIAKTENRKWIVIELNDGCQSGLSCCPPYWLYKNLQEVIKRS
jgi:hypothetical protein